MHEKFTLNIFIEYTCYTGLLCDRHFNSYDNTNVDLLQKLQV